VLSPASGREKGQGVSDYEGKVAVVTGAASGIGYAVAARAAREGMTVALADIDAVDPNFKRSTGRAPS
jgi:NAD(P)-dependent dehydrogenase (short-subunit alcohol dehydrogenase family)